MIMKKWCLLTGPTMIFGAVAVATTARAFFARDYERYLKTPKQEAPAK
ncbi:unnamed protein product [Victoria cruziana]